MTFLADSVLDAALQHIIDHGTRQDICSQEPSTYTEATSTYSLGNKTGITVGAQANGVTSGRRVTIPAVTGGSVTATGTATHNALSKPTATTELLMAKALSAPKAVNNLDTYSTDAQDIEIPDAAA